MLNQLFADAALPDDVNYVPWIIGGGVTLVVLVVGIVLSRRQRDEPASPALPETPSTALIRDPFTHGSSQEGRLEPRRRGGNVSIQIADATGKVLPYEGWVVDRSSGGLCFTVDEPFDMDTVLRVRPVHPEPVPWTPVRVRHCRRSGTSYEIGVQFLQMPQAAVRMLFG